MVLKKWQKRFLFIEKIENFVTYEVLGRYFAAPKMLYIFSTDVYHCLLE